MIPRMIIQGREVNPFYMLDKQMDDVLDSMWDLPKDHPELVAHVKRLEALSLEMLKLRRFHVS